MAQRPVEPAGDSPARVLDWQIACVDADRAIAKTGYTQTFVATKAQRAVLSDALELVGCTALKVAVSARARAGGRYSVTGRIEADVEQVCVVSLEPLRTRVDTPFAGEFCPASALAEALPADPHFDPDGDDDPMPIVDGQLDIGQLAYEHLALAIDPFPRHPDAETANLETLPANANATVSATPLGPDGSSKPNPFAALAKLKLRKDE